jgi:hypothetical protein
LVEGQVRRSKKLLSIRGLNKDHNHDLKGLFKGAATMASVRPGPFLEFYQAALAKGPFHSRPHRVICTGSGTCISNDSQNAENSFSLSLCIIDGWSARFSGGSFTRLSPAPFHGALSRQL